MQLSTLATLLPLIAGSIAAPSNVRSRYALKERHVVPRGWTEGSRPNKNHVIHLQIGLKQSNADELEKHVMEVSTPSHARYGQHLSVEEVERLIAPSKDSIDLVNEWLEEHGIKADSHSPAKDWVNVALPLEKVEELLGTKYSVYTHTDGTSLVRTSEWSLPEHLHEHIDVVQPTNSFFRMNKRSSDAVTADTIEMSIEDYRKHHGGKKDHNPPGYKPDLSKVCNATFVTLDCVKTLYGTLDYKPHACEKNGVGIASYLNETVRRADLKQFLDLYVPGTGNFANEFPQISVANGTLDPTLGPDQLKAGTDLEANLDAQWAVGISYPTPFTAWSTGGMPPYIPDLHEPTNGNEPYQVWLNYVLAQRSLPQVISTSYGDDEQTVPESYAKRACAGFQQLGARGITVLFSSGDSGVGEDGTCFSNTDPSKAEFVPAFPASCPFVTSIGATKGYAPEQAVTRFGSGAGFSNYFKQPHYQHWAVQGYLNKIGDLYKGLYNRHGRAYPDLAAQGDRDVIVWNGKVRTIGGTSASSPTVAGILALVNDALLAKGHPVLGFLNPFLYSKGYKGLTDITVGSSLGCNGTGFPTEEGWDPATGFGTPIFPKLVELALHSWY